jgi:outer membrane immunogenic protein
VKKFILGSAAFVALLTAPAMAADMPLKAPPVMVYNWTGCYGGANGGWKWGQFRESADTAAGALSADHIDLPALNTGSGAVGGQIGCRWETPQHWVFGLEGDFDATDLHGTAVNPTPGASVFVAGDNFGNRASWESSARIIAGHTWDRWLVYGTGGIAFSRVTMESNFIAVTSGGIAFPASSGSASQVLTGGTIGAGAAYALSKSWEIGLEYRYTAYMRGDFALGTVAAVCFGPGIPCLDAAATGHKDLQTQELLFKINYRFNLGGPLVTMN